MSSQSSSAATAQVDDLILGYKLTRKIGSGGYGDVWEVEAPGGLKKALKIVYGYHDERRAQAELKALDRIKVARHPFLLSLERIEIYNSQLIVVSELADKSLSDLGNEYRAKNGQGVPREELIGYMRETADALDYLNDEFQLQHLDIKPENILLVSGHAMVADFGLVKEIKNHDQSMMSGMTPAYAAPELFDGSPATSSDQYSLAIVYQEMLTTVRPFNGTTTAQLAVQHMHGKPDLKPLPVGDQAVVATALAKEPAERYKTCRKYVEELANRKSRKKAVKSRATIRETADTNCKTVDFGGNLVSATELQTDVVASGGMRFTSADIESFDPPQCYPDAAEFQPTIVIAVGESSAKIAQKFKQRLNKRFGSTDQLPSVNFLCIDADNDSLAKLTMESSENSLKGNETLAVPLRRPEQYRKIENLDLSWLSRRWIYNVPRDLKINGLRPLGRLVFADHFEKICDQISKCIEKSILVENVATSCETLEMNPPENVKPNVILISNISGGIGSGMTNDLAYTIRLMLAENGVGDSTLIGMLMHGVKAGRELSLATANSYAYLCELRHFADGGYPGDKRLGIPEFEEELPFDFTYGLRLNVSSEENQSDDLDRIADYLFLSTATKSSSFFEAAREREKESDEFALRSFGLGVNGPGHQDDGKKIVEQISHGVIEHWLNAPIEDYDSAQFVQGICEELKLDAKHATSFVTSAIVESTRWSKINGEIETLINQYETGENLEFGVLKQYYDEIFGFRAADQSDIEPTEFTFAVEPEIGEIGQQIGDYIRTRIMEMINGLEVNFPKVDESLHACMEYVESQISETNERFGAFGKQLFKIEAMFDPRYGAEQTDAETNSQIEVAVTQYSKLRQQAFATRYSNFLFRTIKGRLSGTKDELKKMKMQIEFVGQQFELPEQNQRSAKTRSVKKLMLRKVSDRQSELVRFAQKLVVEEISAGESNDEGFLDLMNNSVGWQKRLPDTIRSIARKVMWNEFKQMNVDDVINSDSVKDEHVKRWIGSLLNESIPFVTDCGGATTLLYAYPKNSEESKVPEMIEAMFDIKSRGIASTSGNVALCFEAENILLANFTFSILKDAPEATELARRIPSREDIKWTTMEDLM